MIGGGGNETEGIGKDQKVQTFLMAVLGIFFFKKDSEHALGE